MTSRIPPRRSSSNRRTRITSGKKSHHLLEVKMRTDTVRRQRTRRINRVVTRVCLLLFFLTSIYFGGKTLLDKFFFKNPDYNVKVLEASLDGILTPQELQQRTGLQEGKNIFIFDLSAAEKKLSELPEVKQAHVERILPSTLRVTLERRIPVLRLASSEDENFIAGQTLVIDQEGIVMSPTELNPNLLQLPVLTGSDLSKAHLGQSLQEEKVQFALRLFNALNNAHDLALNMRSIDLKHGYCAVVTDVNKTHLTFGEDHFSEQIERLQKLYAYCQETGREMESANLMLEHNTPVVFRPNAEPSALTAQIKNRK